MGSPFYPQKRTSSGCCRMSVWCHNRTHASQQTASLFDHLVRTKQQRRRHLKSKCLRIFHINDELEFGRLTKRNVTRISTLENLRNLTCGMAPKFLKIERVGHQSAEFD